MEVEQKDTKFTFNNQKNVLKQIREALGYTQREFASLICISSSSIERYETGKRDPTLTLPQIKKLQLLLFRLGLDFQDLPDDWNVQIKVEKPSEPKREKVGAK